MIALPYITELKLKDEDLKELEERLEQDPFLHDILLEACYVIKDKCENLIETEDELERTRNDLDDAQRECRYLQDIVNQYEGDTTGEAAVGLLEELVDDKYFHVTKTFDTLDKVVERAEFILHYGE